jgi:hypothetical protein
MDPRHGVAPAAKQKKIARPEFFFDHNIWEV